MGRRPLRISRMRPCWSTSPQLTTLFVCCLCLYAFFCIAHVSAQPSQPGSTSLESVNSTNTIDTPEGLSNDTRAGYQVVKQSVRHNTQAKKSISPVALAATIATSVIVLTAIATFLFYYLYHKKHLRPAVGKQADIEKLGNHGEETMLPFADANAPSMTSTPTPPKEANVPNSNAAQKRPSTFSDPKNVGNESSGVKSNHPSQPKVYKTDSRRQKARRTLSRTFSGFKMGNESSGIARSATHDMSRTSISLLGADVKRATRNFEFKIGEGGFGSVYFGKLPGTRMEVAVKVQAKKSRQGAREFATEVEILSRCNHPNLVSLVGYSEEEGGYMLVYEFLSGGTLQERLYGNRSNPALDWNTRLKIAVQAAEGLEYLHSECVPSIIHRDVKSSNILLTKLDDGKVADFGLSKFLKANAKHISKCSVKGTSGYVDPEYFQTQTLTHKSDVYSFGIVLLELVSGQEPLDTNRHQSEWKISNWAGNLLTKGNIDKVADEALNGKYKLESMWTVAELAMTCVEPRSIHRPTISEVVQELQKAVKEEANGTKVP